MAKKINKDSIAWRPFKISFVPSDQVMTESKAKRYFMACGFVDIILTAIINRG